MEIHYQLKMHPWAYLQNGFCSSGLSLLTGNEAPGDRFPVREVVGAFAKGPSWKVVLKIKLSSMRVENGPVAVTHESCDKRAQKIAVVLIDSAYIYVSIIFPLYITIFP